MEGGIMETDRKEFLFHIYEQMWLNINRHILVVWQSVGVVVGSFAALSLVEKRVVTLDVAAILILLLATWLVAHTHDANVWFYRNHTVIRNIERQFFSVEDKDTIHPFFCEQRDPRKMLMHLKIQKLLGYSVAGVILLHHLKERMLPALVVVVPVTEFAFRATPYLVAAVLLVVIARFAKRSREKNRHMADNSPGAVLGSEMPS